MGRHPKAVETLLEHVGPRRARRQIFLDLQVLLGLSTKGTLKTLTTVTVTAIFLLVFMWMGIIFTMETLDGR